MATIIWKIRYLDRADRFFKDRQLILKTETLSAEHGAAVELAIEAADIGVLAFRHLFQEFTGDELAARAFSPKMQFPQIVFVPDYFEDESGKQISLDEIGAIQTGNPDV